MAARVRVLNIWTLSGGPLPIPPPPTGAWDLEAEWPMLLAKRTPAPLMQVDALVVTPRIIPRGWSVAAEPSFIRPFAVAKGSFVSSVPLPYAILTTTASTPNGSFVLTFASVPSSVVIGMNVVDLTNNAVISAGTTVQSKTATTVTLSQSVTGAGVSSGDRILFSY